MPRLKAIFLGFVTVAYYDQHLQQVVLVLARPAVGTFSQLSCNKTSRDYRRIMVAALRQMPAADVPNKASWPKRDEFRGRRAAQSPSCLRIHARRSAGIRSLRDVGLQSQLVVSFLPFLCSTFDIAFFVRPFHLRISRTKEKHGYHYGVTLSTPLGRSSTCTPRTARIPFFAVALFSVAPVVGRYRKGKTTLIGNLWWEVHEDCMVICAEALLPLAITAIFTTGGPHNSSHAKWGEDMYERMRNPGLRRREETIDTVRGA